jgi:hypothetical protein
MMAKIEGMGVPFFYNFGWGGHDHPEFREARRQAMAYCDMRKK